MQIIILVGIPGSGKSHKARELMKDNRGFITLSKDQLTIDRFGEYRFDPSIVDEIQMQHLRDIVKAMQRKVPGIIVDNTNVSVTLRQHFLLFAKMYNYIPTIIVINSGLSDAELFARNVHNVPLEVISAMRKILQEQGLY